MLSLLCARRRKSRPSTRAPRKQRHTAHPVWQRLRQEYPDQPVGEATVRRYLQERKQELGLSGREVFVSRSYAVGQGFHQGISAWRSSRRTARNAVSNSGRVSI